jgi:hypothetical protein
MRMLAVGLCAIVVAASMAPGAGAATRRATDSRAGIRFTLDDRVLTVRILRSAPRRIRRQLFGSRITAICQRYTPVVRVARTRLWPSGARSARFRFRRNISRRVSWCLLEHRRGVDIAFVSFVR